MPWKMSEILEGRPRADSAEIAFRKIFIGGLSYSTDEEKLKKYFKSYGPVQDAVVMKDPVTKRSRGFGFITFFDVPSVDNVLANEPHTVDGRKVEAKRAVPRSEMSKELAQRPGLPSAPPSASSTPSTSQHKSISTPGTPLMSPQISTSKSSQPLPSTPTSESRFSDAKLNSDEYAYNKIFVGGLHYDTRDAEFRSYFERFGSVVSAEVMFNRETHKSRGFGFIIFETEECAIRSCSEKEHIINGKIVEVKRAIPRSKMGSPTGSTILASNSGDSIPKATSVPSDIRGRSKSDAPLPISGNTSTLAASMNTGSPSSLHRKQLSSQNAARPPSYAAALKGPGGETLAGQNNLAGGSLSPRDYSGTSNTTSSSIFGQHGISLFPSVDESQLDSLIPTRTSRAFSEPIVRMDPLIDLSAFNSRGLGGGIASGAAWLESSPNGAAAPTTPEAWTRLLSSLSAESNHALDSSSNGTSQPPQLADPSQSSYYTLLNDETPGSATSSASWSRRHSEPLILSGLGFDSGLGFGEPVVTTRSRSASRDENGSLILGITQQARNSRANSISTDLDMLPPLQQQAQRRSSHSQNLQLNEFGTDDSRTNSSGNSDIWGSNYR